MNVIDTKNAPGAIGPYSQAYEHNALVITSGQIPVNPADGSVPEGIAAPPAPSLRASPPRLSRAAKMSVRFWQKQEPGLRKS